ncbi:acyltransferase family protein [Sandarakinorhabdus oryzae]|uniref:acyltransferase family protein n=1 Tax=Sandarakinorhabdus oryzae TaxID=2675220 RepID=UPI0018CC483E|nr:acyltransferase [Sandarakinorhabdus oryzae]
MPGPGGLRLILALVVLISHLSALNIGRPAVVLFFISSGYWVSRRWLANGEGPGRFVVLRLLRIWPLFALVGALTWAARDWLGMPQSPDPLGGLLLLGSASRGDMLTGVAWSLDLELQFYLCLPLLWLAAQRLPGWQLWLLGGLAWGLGMWLMAHGAWTFLLYLPAFVAGMWLAGGPPLTERDGPLAGHAAALAGAGGFVLVAGLFALLPVTRPLLVKGPGLSLLVEQLAHLGWALLLLPVVARVLVRPSGRLDRQLGDAAYALYLVHSPVITCLGAALALEGFALKLATLPAVVLATMLLHVWVDRPLESARRRAAFRFPAFAPLNLGAKRPN